MGYSQRPSLSLVCSFRLTTADVDDSVIAVLKPRNMMSGKLPTISVGVGLCNKLAWHPDNPQSKPALQLGFIS